MLFRAFATGFVFFLCNSLLAANQMLSIDEENDKFAFRGEDRHYTQGLRATAMGEEDIVRGTDVPPMHWLDKYPLLGFSVGDSVISRRYGVAIGQNIYTPQDITQTNLITNDRPYAGWLYAGFIYQRTATNGLHLDLMDSFEFEAGVVGSYSYAKEAQTAVHRLLGVQKPLGWTNQLKNEPGLLIDYQRTYRYAVPLDCKETESNDWRLDLMPHAGAAVGTIKDEANLGAMFRVGYRIPNTVGLTPGVPQKLGFDGGTGETEYVTPPRARFGVYCLGDAVGRLVGRNEFLDGNLFRTGSHHVDKEPFVYDLRAGVMFTFKSWEIGYIYNYRSEEFKGQAGANRFGTFTLRIYF